MTDQTASQVRDSLALNFQEILTATVRLRSNRKQQVDDAETFRANTLATLQAAEQRSRAAGYSGTLFKTGLLAVVGFLDESILNCRNPVFADWARRPLTEQIFGHHKAGEVFFDNLNNLLVQNNTSAYADVLEVYYLCLLLGFGGRYLGNKGELRSIRETTADKIRQIRGSDPDFCPDWAPPVKTVARTRRDPWLRPLVLLAAAFVLLTLSLFAVFKISLNRGVAHLGQAAYTSDRP